MAIDATVGVTGMNATDNPGPGVGVVRSLRLAPGFSGRVVGLAYDALDPGIYLDELLDASFIIPYPSEGADALLRRLRYVHERAGLDVVIPTLDAELPSFLSIEEELGALGVHTFLPTREQFDLRSKVRLHELGRGSDIDVPASEVVTEVKQLYTIHERLAYPFVLKGLFYGARVVHGVDDALKAFHATAARWGLPVIAQQFVAGEEFDVVAVGDGAGGLIGAVPMRKTHVTEAGKGWAGVAVTDPELLAIAERFMAATSWRGPCELEVLVSREGTYHLVEVNPRFPAWTYLSAAAGRNLVEATVRLALGEEVEPMPPPRAGTLFVRISLDLAARMEDLERISTAGEIVRTTDEEDDDEAAL